MKKIWFVSLLFGALIFTNSCDNTVDLTTEFKDIPVVYGLLSQQDTMHYIKIERAFLGGDGNNNALDIAQIADSIYYDNLDVKVEHVNSGEIYSLTKVDGSTVGLEREDGIFASDPNTLYTFELNGDEMEEGDEFILRINRGDDLPEITASTLIVGDFDFIAPIQPTDIDIKYRTTTLSWKKKESTAFYDVSMIIYYLEEDPSNPGFFEEKTLKWEMLKNLSAVNGGSNTFAASYDGEEFYRFIGAELDEIGGAKRIFISFDFEVDAGGQALFDYINIGQANTGITSSQLIPTYSNLSEGFGVFSSRVKVPYAGFTLKSDSRDSLANGIYTKTLGFED